MIKEIKKLLLNPENLEMTFALIGALIIGIMSIYQNTVGNVAWIDKAIDPATLLVLSLLAFGMVRDRVLAQEIKSHLDRMSPQSRQDVEIRDLFQEEVKSIIQAADKHLCCLLRTGSILDELDVDFLDALNKGCDMQVIMCEKDPTLVSKIAFAMKKPVDRVDSKFLDGHAAIRSLSSEGHGKIDYRLTHHIPESLAFIANPDGPAGQAFIVPMSFQENVRRAPSIRVSRAEQRKIFDYYVYEFRRYWDIGAKRSIEEILSQETELANQSEERKHEG